MVGDSLFGFHQTFGVFGLGVGQSGISLYVAAVLGHSVIFPQTPLRVVNAAGGVLASDSEDGKWL